jgi:hypothetical protein
MTAWLIAVSASSTFTKAGALVAFAALVALAVLFVLAARHGHEIKRLREWAGRAPERAAEEQNRVRAEASLRAGQSAAHEAGRSDTGRSRVRLALLVAGALVVVGVVVIGA